MQVQQGDVLAEKIDKLPAGLKVRKPGKRGHVLAEGEATGHAHTVEARDGLDMYEADDGTLYLVVEKTATVKHEEHKPVTLEPGVWQIGRVREYDWLEKMARPVQD